MEQACLYLTEKRYPDDCTATRKRQIRQKAKKFAVIDGELFLQTESRPGKVLCPYVTPPEY